MEVTVHIFYDIAMKELKLAYGARVTLKEKKEEVII